MLKWTAIFGFTGIAEGAASIEKIIFIIFLVLVILFGLLGLTIYKNK